MKHISCAQWPAGTLGGADNDISRDSHDTKDQAQAVCDMLLYRGLGGDGEVFPTKTWVEPAKAADEPPSAVLPPHAEGAHEKIVLLLKPCDERPLPVLTDHSKDALHYGTETGCRPVSRRYRRISQANWWFGSMRKAMK